MQKSFILFILLLLNFSIYAQFNCTAAVDLACGETVNSNNYSQCNNFFNGPYCNSNDALYTGKEKIYKITVTYAQTASFVLSNCTADLDMFLTYSCSPQACLTSSHNSGASINEQITVTLQPGTYYLIIDGWAGATSNFTLSYTCIASAGQLDCTLALPINCNSTVTGSTEDGVNNVVGPYCGQHCNYTGKEKIYKFTVDYTGVYTIKLWGLNADVDLFLLNSCSRSSCVGVSGQPSANTEGISMTLTPDTYYIVIDGYKGAISNYNLTLSCPTVSPPVDCATLVSNYYAGNGSDLKFGFKFNSNYACIFRGWKIGNTLYSTSTHVNFIFNTPGTYNVCAEYLDIATNTIKQCCRTICASLPTNCTDLIQYTYTNGKFTLSLAGNAANFSNITWRNDTDKLNIDPNNVAADCRNIVVSVSFYDNVTKCWTVCCKRISFCPPTSCQDNIISSYNPIGNKFTFSFNNTTATNVKWYFDDTKTIIPNGQFVLPTGWTCTQKVISVTYFDTASQCWRICCKSVFLCPPVDCQTAIQYSYNSAYNKYIFTLNVPNSGNAVWKFEEGNIHLPNGEFVVPSGYACGNKTVSVSYYDMANYVWRTCSRVIYICPPVNCQDNIGFQYVANGNKFVFSLAGANNANVVWKFEDDNNILPNGVFVLPSNWVCKEKTIQAYYYSSSSQCWLLCSKTVTICPPTSCQASIDYNYVENGNKFVFTLSVPGATNLYWKIDEDNINLPNGIFSFTPSWTCAMKTITVIYYDSYSKCWRNCCKKVNLCPPGHCSESIDVQFNLAANKYTFLLDNIGASQLSWSFEDGTPLPNGEFSVPAGFNCQNKKVRVKYFTASTMTWNICEKAVTICPSNQCEASIDFSYNNNATAITFSLNNSNASNVKWYFEEGYTPIPNGYFEIPSNWICAEKTIVVKYLDGNTGCYKFCSRKVYICPPVNCDELISYNYVSGQNKFHFALNVAGASNVTWKIVEDNIILDNGDFIFPTNWACTEKTILVSFYNPATHCWSTCSKKVNLCPPNQCQQSITYTFNDPGTAIAFHLLGVPEASNISWIIEETGQQIGHGIQSNTIPVPNPCANLTATARYTINGIWHVCCKKINMCSPYACSSAISHVIVGNTIHLSIPSGSEDPVWTSTTQIINSNGINATVALPTTNGIVVVDCTYKDNVIGAYRTCKKEIVINCNPPIANFTIIQNNSGSYQLLNQSVDSETVTWDFDGAVPVSGDVHSQSVELVFSHSGVYNICLTARNDCGSKTYCKELTIDNGNGCGFSLGQEVCGSLGQEILVPIKINNFNNILAFNFTIKSGNSSLVQLLGCEQFHPAIASGNYFYVDTEGIRFFWSDTQGKSIPDNTVLFYVRVKLKSMFSNPVAISFVNDPVKIECFNTNQKLVPMVIGAGSVCMNQNASINGMVTTDDNAAVTNVEMRINNGSMKMNQNTGLYDYTDLSMGQNYEVIPSKDINHVNGLNGLDIVKLQRHILSIEKLNSPHKIIAADVNKDKVINALDIVNLQKIILRIIDKFPNNTSWRFVPKSYVFNTNDVLNEAFPETIKFAPLMSNQTGQDFIAIKIGDLNGSADHNFDREFVNQNRSTNDTLQLRLPNQYVNSNSQVTIPVTVKNFRDLISLENTFSWNTDHLEFAGLSNFNLNNLGSNNFGTSLVSEGKLLFSWFDSQINGIDLEDNTTLFNINFKLKPGFPGQSSVSFSQTPLSSLAINSGLEQVAIIFSSANVQALEALSYTAEKRNITCFSGADGSIKLIVSGGTNNFIYQWDNGTNQSENVNLTIGQYKCTVTDVITGNTIVVVEDLTSPTNIEVSIVSAIDGATQKVNFIANAIGGVPPYEYKWSNGGNTNKLENVDHGIYNLTITDANGCIVRSSAESIISGIADVSDNEHFEIYPNPARDILNLVLKGNTECNYNWIIYNSMGQQVDQGKNNSCYKNTIELKGMVKGLYFLNIRQSNQMYTFRFDIM